MTDPAQTPTTLAVALAYAACGIRVLPIVPKSKRPPMKAWVEAATTDIDIITSWFTHLYADHGVGLAMGRQPDGRIIFALDVDEHDPTHSGSETLADLEAEHGSLPDTVRSITGSSGLHLLFTAAVEVRNGIAGDGLDVRGEGGQIVVAPTIHPATGREYVWEHGFAPWERGIAEAPEWLLALVVATTPTPSPQPSTPPSVGPTPQFADPDSPAEWLRAQWQWPLQLRDAGWVEHHTERNGDIHWTRPGKDPRHGASAILHQPNGPFVVFSTDASVTGLHRAGHVNRDGSVSVTPFDFYAVHRHGGDTATAGRTLRAMMDPTASRLSVSPPIGEPDAVLAGYLAQFVDFPALWADDHSGEDWLAEPLLPKGRQVVLYAPSKHGKSELAFAVVAAMATGKPILGRPNPLPPQHVVYLDYEMTPADLRERLELLGYDENDDYSHLHYALLPSLPALDTKEGCDAVRALCAWHEAKTIVIDTMGHAVEGDENDNNTYRAFARLTGMMLKADGVSVLRTDHAGKEKEKGQRGASAKNDDGDVVFRVDKTDTGWKLDRTHTRVGWVPKDVLIDRTELSDGTLKIEWQHNQAASYLPGTSVLVADMRKLGLDHTSTRRKVADTLKAAGQGASAKRIGDALRWMRTEVPMFGNATPFTPTTADRRLSDDPELGDIT